jgi:hypothetical protein
LKRIPFDAKKVVPFAIIPGHPVGILLAQAYGLRGWNTVDSFWGGAAEPNISLDEAW